MYRQIKRYRGKRLQRRRAGPTADALEAIAELEPLPIDEMFDDSDEENPRIVRRKSFALHPMSPEEAIEQMELLGHDFYMFFNTEDEVINVVYRRRGQDYGLLQPEFE
jgi:putative sigma-54 modulation protein